MAIAFVAAATNSASTNDANPNVTLPAGRAANDYAVVAVSYKNNSVFTPPAGWTLLSTSGSANNNTSVVYGKKLDGSETTFSGTLATAIRWAVVCSVYRGVSAAGVASHADSGLTTSTTAVVATPITPLVDDTLRLGIGGVRGSTNVSVTYNTTPAGWSLRGQASSSGATTNVAAAIYDVQLTGQAGVAQSAQTATVSDASAYASHSITLVPAATGGTAHTDPQPLKAALNRVAGTSGLESQGAAQVWAGAPGMALLGALNKKNGTQGLGLLAVLNDLAGTSGLGEDAAAGKLNN